MYSFTLDYLTKGIGLENPQIRNTPEQSSFKSLMKPFSHLHVPSEAQHSLGLSHVQAVN